MYLVSQISEKSFLSFFFVLLFLSDLACIIMSTDVL